MTQGDAVRFCGTFTVALMLCLTALPLAVRAACNSALSTPSLQGLDIQVDTDPAAVASEAERRLKALGGSDALQAAELQALLASAYDMLDDGKAARAAVAASRELLLHVPAGAPRRTLEVRLALIQADSPETKSDMTASTELLTALERSMPPQSLDHACLLVVRSRLNAQLIRNAEATRDGMEAYRIAMALKQPEVQADAAYQLAMTYLRAGLLADAGQMADEAIEYNRSTRKSAALSDALYIKAYVLDEMRQYQAALRSIDESRALNVPLHATIDVAFADKERCNVLIELGRLDDAERACRAAAPVFSAADRLDMYAVVAGNLARIALAQGQPARALARLDQVLQHDVERVPPKDLPRLYRYRSEALSQVGRVREALKDLQESVRLTEADGAQRSSLAAATIKERLNDEIMYEEKQALEAQMLLERQKALAQERQVHLSIALAIAAGLLLVLMTYLLWIRTRHERALRRASETLETHTRVIATVREGVLLLDDRGQIEYANPSLLRMFGKSSGDLLGAPVQRLGVARSDLDAPAGEDAGGLPMGARELHLQNGAGKPIVLLVTSSVLNLHERALLVCVLQDVTELRRLERKILTDASSERGQLSSEVHEGIAQDLAGIALLLEGIKGGSGSDAATIGFIVDHVNNALQRARTLARGLSPVQVAGGSLALALSRSAADIARSRSIDVVCGSDLSGLDLSPTQSDHVYRIALECLRFAARRPDCGKVSVELRAEGGALSLTSTGNGTAPTGRVFDDGRGWGTIAYLARILGGSARVDEVEGEGTRVTVSVPVTKLAAGAPDPFSQSAAAG